MKLLIADDHALFRDALLLYLNRAQPEAEVEVVEDFYAVRDILKAGRRFDLVILDLRMLGMRGLDGLKEVRYDYPDLPVALMSGVAGAEDVERAMALGARGYFPKTLSGKALIDAIHTVLMGRIYMPLDNDGAGVMPSYFDDGKVMADEKAKEMNLTPKEIEVLSGLTQGLLNKEIADSMDIEIVTVKMHVRNICQKLEVSNRTQAALKARDLWAGD